MQAYSTQSTSKLKHKRVKREVVEVHGGRIVRSNGRTDRHSKVCTVRGPRDRRVRLSPNTAIQFYDVQDRLGYDRPSKAIDWLMKEAKAAIDALDESNNAGDVNPTIFMQSAGDHGASELGLHEFLPHYIQSQHEKNSSITSFFSQDYFNQTTNCHSFSGLNDATSSSTTSNDFLKYQTQGLSLSFHPSQDFSPFGSQQSSIPLDTQTNTELLAYGQRIHRGNSCSCNAGVDSELNCLPLQIPSTFDENHLLNCHREPLQSNFSAPFHDQHHSFNYANTTFSSDGILGLSNPSTFHGEEQSQVSCKPTSSTPFLLHYQE